MDKDTFINQIKEIGSCEDNLERLNKLTSLQEEVTKVFDDKSGLETENQTLKDSITEKDKEIQKANEYAMKMFLKKWGAKNRRSGAISKHRNKGRRKKRI